MLPLPIPIVNKHISLKIGGLFAVTLILIVLFSVIYWYGFKKSYTEALYSAVLLQTLNGKGSSTIKDDNEGAKEKMVNSVQSILAYMITSGLLIVSMV